MAQVETTINAGLAALRNPQTGRVDWFPLDKATELADAGWQGVLPDQAKREERSAIYGDPWKALEAGVARGVTFGLSDVAQDASGAGEEMAAMREESPWASGLGEVAGGMLGLATGAGPAAGLSRTGAAITAKVGERLGSGVLARAAAKGAGLGAEGAGWGIGGGVSELALKDGPIGAADAAKTLAGHAAATGGFGAGLGVAGSLIGSGFQGVGRRAKYAEERMGLLREHEAEMGARADELQSVVGRFGTESDLAAAVAKGENEISNLNRKSAELLRRNGFGTRADALESLGAQLDDAAQFQRRVVDAQTELEDAIRWRDQLGRELKEVGGEAAGEKAAFTAEAKAAREVAGAEAKAAKEAAKKEWKDRLQAAQTAEDAAKLDVDTYRDVVRRLEKAERAKAPASGEVSDFQEEVRRTVAGAKKKAASTLDERFKGTKGPELEEHMGRKAALYDEVMKSPEMRRAESTHEVLETLEDAVDKLGATKRGLKWDELGPHLRKDVNARARLQAIDKYYNEALGKTRTEGMKKAINENFVDSLAKIYKTVTGKPLGKLSIDRAKAEYPFISTKDMTRQATSKVDDLVAKYREAPTPAAAPKNIQLEEAATKLRRAETRYRDARAATKEVKRTGWKAPEAKGAQVGPAPTEKANVKQAIAQARLDAEAQLAEAKNNLAKARAEFGFKYPAKTLAKARSEYEALLKVSGQWHDVMRAQEQLTRQRQALQHIKELAEPSPAMLKRIERMQEIDAQFTGKKARFIDKVVRRATELGATRTIFQSMGGAGATTWQAARGGLMQAGKWAVARQAATALAPKAVQLFSFALNPDHWKFAQTIGRKAIRPMLAPAKLAVFQAAGMPDAEDLRKDLEEFTPEQRELMLYQALAENDPRLTEAMVEQQMRLYKFLDGKVPRDPSGLYREPGELAINYGPEWQPPKSEMDRFMRYARAAMDPGSAIKDLAAGAFTREHAEALDAVHPELYDGLKLMMKARIRKEQAKGVRYPRQAAQQFAIFLQEPSVMMVSGQGVQRLQDNFKPEERKQPTRGKGGPALNLHQQLMTEMQRIQAR